MNGDPAKLSVRVGVGMTPVGGEAGAGERFWEVIEALEEVGYDSIWVADSGLRGGVAPLPLLAAVAARTERLKLGIGVLVLPARNPLALARELATLEAISGGRVLPAGGLGVDSAREIAAAGLERGERPARLEECVTILKALWPGEPISYEGRFSRLDEVRLEPRPPRPRLEHWLGGRAPAALRRIGRIADGWLASFVSPEELGAGIETIRAAAAAAGRTIDEDHYGTTLFSAPSEAEISPEIRERLGRRPELALEDFVAVGADATRELLERYLAVGATKFVLNPLGEDPAAWLRELHPAVVEPLERAGA